MSFFSIKRILTKNIFYSFMQFFHCITFSTVNNHNILLNKQVLAVIETYINGAERTDMIWYDIIRHILRIPITK
jgi:hypothetical protein